MRYAATIFALLIATPAAAQRSDDDRARGHNEAGESYFEQSRFEEAATEFEEAYRLSGRPEMLLNMATALERADDLQGSIAALERYLELPDPPDRASVEARLASVRERQTERGGADRGDPPGQPRSSGDTTTTFGWITLAAAGAVAVTSIVLGVVASGERQDLVDACGGMRCDESHRDDVDRARTYATISTATTFAAVGLAALGVALLLLDGDEGDVQVMGVATPSFVGAGLSGRL